MYMTQVMPPLRVMNLNYSLSVKHMLEGLLEHDHITVNTSMCNRETDR